MMSGPELLADLIPVIVTCGPKIDTIQEVKVTYLARCPLVDVIQQFKIADCLIAVRVCRMRGAHVGQELDVVIRQFIGFIHFNGEARLRV